MKMVLSNIEHRIELILYISLLIVELFVSS